MNTVLDLAAVDACPAPGSSGHALEQADWLLELAPVGICVCDRSGMIVRFNQRAAQVWGRDAKLRDPCERFCGSWRLYQRNGTPLPHSQSPIAEVLRCGAPVRDWDVLVERPDGSRRTVLANARALTDASGAIIGAISCLQDITGTAAESASSQRGAGPCAREVLESLPIAVYTVDTQGRITFYNDAAAQLWHRRPELGETRWCGFWHLRSADGVPMAHEECPMALAVKQGRAVEAAEVLAERHDGTCAVLLACPSVLHDEAGTVIGAVNALIDVSNFKHNQQLTQRLACIVESSQDAIVSKDLSGIVQSWNRGAQALFGYRAEEIVGKPISLLIPPDRLEEELNILSRLRRGERIEHYETVRMRKDGTPVEVSLTVSPLCDVNGRVTGASKVARDISARKRAEEQRELLLREMAHRVKNLFALVSGMVGLSMRYAHTPQELAEVLQARMWALSRAHELTLPAGQAGHADRATTLHELAQAILSPHVATDDRTGKRLFLDGPRIAVSGVAVTSLALLLHEFATNAAKYGALKSPAGRIHLQWHTEQDELHLAWRESGGPRIEQPARSEGFGSLLARQTVVNQFRGRITHEWRPEGLVVHLWARTSCLCGEAAT